MFEPRLLHQVHEGEGPVIGLATRAGHQIRPDLLRLTEIDELGRMREEDPFTDFLAFACDSQFLPRRSRFEADLNRTREQALCVVPEDCWGLRIWRPEAGEAVRPLALEEHDEFYRRLEEMLRQAEGRHGRFVVFDLHSYNHRRGGPEAPPAPAEENPEVILGTGSVDRERWAPVVDRFLQVMRGADVAADAPTCARTSSSAAARWRGSCTRAFQGPAARSPSRSRRRS